MDEFRLRPLLGAAVEAASMDVDFEGDDTLGEHMDTDGSPCDHKSIESDAPAKMPDESGGGGSKTPGLAIKAQTRGYD